MNHQDKLSLLIQKLRALKLFGMVNVVADLLDRAAQTNIPTLDVIDQLLDEERTGRRQRAVERRITDAHFRRGLRR
jgi:hypothetical protein